MNIAVMFESGSLSETGCISRLGQGIFRLTIAYDDAKISPGNST
jgi:hypothetical protein